MRTLFGRPALAGFFLSAGLLLSNPVAHGQTAIPAGSTAAHGYAFLTVSSVNGLTKNTSKMLLTPSFQGKAEVQLEDLSGSSLAVAKDMAVTQHNILIVNQQLEELTTAGWELIQVYAVGQTTYYLLRKAKS